VGDCSPFVGVGRQPTGMTVTVSNYSLGDNTMTMYDSFAPDPRRVVQQILQTGVGFTLDQSRLKSGSFFAFLNASSPTTISFMMSFTAAPST
jgi:hypothetical protein